jgi:hypothetical protein
MKTKVLTLLLVTLVSLGMASGVTNHEGEPGEPSITTQPDVPDPVDGNQTGIGNLPAQASDTAKQVLDTVNKFLEGSIGNLGEALSNLLQPEDTNQTETQ